MKQTPQTLKGFRDFLPQNLAIRNYVKSIFVQTFENFGFEPLETPALEYASTLLGKYGQEADKLVYKFTDQGDREIGLRYDLTVPVSKVLAIYQNQIPLPFKRYQIQPVWRAEKPQKGRYREILQCDIDTFGPKSPINDAEIIAVIYQILKQLNFNKYSIRLNSRIVLSQILNQAGISENQQSILQSLDKTQKIGQEGVSTELIQKGLSQSQIDLLYSSIGSAKPDPYLQSVIENLKAFDLPQEVYVFDPTMIRGLDYYTGPIFETYVEKPKIGSITGGGRYDNLIETLGGPPIPAVGTTIGLDRIVDVISELNLLPNIPKTSTKIMVANFGPDTENESLKLASALRGQNITTLLYPNADKLSKQFKYASDKSIPFVAVIGPDEASNNLVSLKNMNTGEQKTISTSDLLAQLS